MTKPLRRNVLAAARRNKQSELTKHLVGELGIAVIPGKDSLGCIPAAQQKHLNPGIMHTSFARDLRKQPAFRHAY